MPSKLPKDYHAQDGCHNCGHVFRRDMYEEGPDYYCTVYQGDGPRPPCMSGAMDETGYERGASQAVYRAARARWDAWEEGREVKPWGVCSMWYEASGR
jgi:hypothetical protein